MTPRPRARSRTLVFALVVVLGAATSAVVLGELVLQAYHRWTVGTWLVTETKAFRVTCVAPVADDREYALRPGFRDADVSVDALGFREHGIPGPSPGAEVVVALGDSVPFGAGVSSSDSYPAFLDRELSASGVRVLNAGVPSYTIRQSIRRLFVDVLPHFTPRVITLQAANDVSLFARHGVRWKRTSTWAGPKFKDQLPAGWSASFAISHYSDAAAFHLRERLVERTTLASARQRMLDSIREDVAQLRADPRLAGVPIVLLPIDPFYYQEDRNRSETLKAWKGHERRTIPWWDLVRDINLTLQASAAPGKGLHWFDTRPVLDAAGREGLYVDWIHLGRTGASLVAKALADYIRKSGWVRQG